MQNSVVRRIRTFSLWLLSGFVVIVHYAYGMEDNRYLGPIVEYQPFLVNRAACMFSIAPFYLTADRCFNTYGDEQSLFDFGEQAYGLRALDKALVAAGVTDQSLLRSDWQIALTTGPYTRGGKLQGEGVSLNVFYPFANHWAFGVRGAFMGITTVMELRRDTALFEGVVMGPGDDNELIQTQERILNALGMTSALWHEHTLTDTELYFQLFSMEDYAYRCRHLDASLALGVVAPTAVKKQWDNPASIPCGGNGHWGIYLEGCLDATLKQDFRGSLLFRIQKRLAKTEHRRIPVGKEPDDFGALMGPVRVDPGWTFVAEPYLIFEHLREGLGAWVGYTLVSHMADSYQDERCDTSVPAQFALMLNDSSWGTERMHVGIFYNLEDGRSHHAVEPLVYLTADIPVDWIVSRRSFKTYGISLGIESYF